MWKRGLRAPKTIDPAVLPMPPAELRAWVGPREEERYENPTRGLVYADIPAELYDTVFDFGCGCGRVARQLILQEQRPRRYVGVDLHPAMIGWCRHNLEPLAREFTFLHHDVLDPLVNPGPEKPGALPLPVEDSSVSLFEALSVYTHIVERNLPFYFAEMARVLRPDGLANASFLLFEKDEFPPLGSARNSLYIDDAYPPAAVYYDRRWLERTLSEAGLTIVAVAQAPAVRGYQWRLHIARAGPAATPVAIPVDDKPTGRPGDLPASA